MKPQKWNWDNYAQVAAKYCLPHKAKIIDKKSEGERVETDVFDSTAIDSAQILAAGLHTFLSSPYSQWFQIGFKKREYQQNKELQEWAAETSEYIFSVLNGTNFSRTVAEFYRDFVVLPGANIYQEEDVKDITRFTSIPYEESLIKQNHRGIVDMVYRDFKYDVYQAYSRWGDKCGKEISELYEKKKYDQKFDFIHATGPRHVRKVGSKSSKDMPFYSCYLLKEKKIKVEESGYEENPYHVGRWGKVSGETWGYSPAMVRIADILMLNGISETNIRAAMKATDPAWLFPDENFMMPLNFNPQAINWRTGDPTEKPMPLISGGRPDLGLEFENVRRQAVMKGFFVDLFMITQDHKMTAYEVAQRSQRQMLILGAVIADIVDEVLEPILLRTMKIAYRRQELPEIPLEGVAFEDLAFDYISPLAIAQKQARSQNLQAFIGSIMQMSQMFPAVLDKVNSDKAYDEMAKDSAIPPAITFSDKDVKAMRQARAEQQQQMAQVAMAKEGGAAAKSFAEADKALRPEKK